MKRSLYISDLDGTLLHSDVKLSERTITILNKLIDRGMMFSVATARSIASVKTILRDVNISVPIVLMNGVCIYDIQKNDYIKVEYLPKTSIIQLMKVIKENNLKGFAYTINNGIMSTYYEELNTKALKDFYQERVDRYQKRFTQIDDFTLLSDEPLMYFSLLDRKEKLEPIYQLVEGISDLNCVFYKDNYSPDLWYMEIFSLKASKYHAVSFLRSYLKVDHIVCFGDNRNDLPLFEASDFRIAVENAVSELKDKANLIIGNHNDDGVADWLEHTY